MNCCVCQKDDRLCPLTLKNLLHFWIFVGLVIRRFEVGDFGVVADPLSSQAILGFENNLELLSLRLREDAKLS